MASPVQDQPSHSPGAGPHSHGAVWIWPSVPSPQSGQGHSIGAQCGTKPGTWGHPVHHPASPTHRRGRETHLQSHKNLQETEPRGSPYLGPGTLQPLHPQDIARHSPILASLSLGWPEHGDRPHTGLPENHVLPTVGGEVVGHILTQTHSPDALLKLVRDGVADQAGPSCTWGDTIDGLRPYLALPRRLPCPCTRLRAQGAFSSEKWVPSSPLTSSPTASGDNSPAGE